MRTCPVCASQQRTKVYVSQFLKVEQVVWSCGECGMVYASSPPVDYVDESIYTDLAVYGARPEDVSHYRQIAERLSGWKGARVLEIGCATGGLLEVLREGGWRDVTGYDLSPRATAICRGRGLKAVDELSGAWDVVVLSHVLEHVPEPRELLGRVKGLLAPQGVAYVEVPNATRYDKFTSLAQGFNLEHINHFTAYHLEVAMVRVGFTKLAAGAYEFAYGHDTTYPAIWQLSQRGWYDPRYIAPYVQKLAVEADRVWAWFAEVKARAPRVAVWGLGQLTLRLFSRQGPEVVAATDTNSVFHGRRMLEVTVVAPEEFKPPQEVPILVCSQLRRAEIVARIQELGLTNEIITLGEPPPPWSPAEAMRTALKW